MIKTDVTKSPLLQPVIQREYTRGMEFNNQKTTPGPDTSTPPPPGPTPGPGPGANFTPPPPPPGPTPGDTTKEFAFDEPTESPSDLGEGEHGPGLNIPAGSARTFANTIGNLVQIYLPRATYGYVMIDMESVRMNVETGHLTFNFIDAFQKMNESAEEALKIPDENIKMWKAAFQHYLEYKQVAFANPETEFWVATAALLTDQGIRTFQLKRKLEEYMREAIEHSNPGIFEKKAPAPPRAGENVNNENLSQNDNRRAA